MQLLNHTLLLSCLFLLLAVPQTLGTIIHLEINHLVSPGEKFSVSSPYGGIGFRNSSHWVHTMEGNSHWLVQEESQNASSGITYAPVEQGKSIGPNLDYNFGCSDPINIVPLYDEHYYPFTSQYYVQGNFPPGSVYFQGIAFTAVPDDQFRYGWVRLSTDSLFIYDFAYETSPSTPIIAGLVPEPATLLLLILSALPLLRHR